MFINKWILQIKINRQIFPTKTARFREPKHSQLQSQKEYSIKPRHRQPTTLKSHGIAKTINTH